MNAREFIDIICPNHSRTSCSDTDIENSFYISDDRETISNKYHPRCTRCALLDINNGTINLSQDNIKIISEILDF